MVKKHRFSQPTFLVDCEGGTQFSKTKKYQIMNIRKNINNSLRTALFTIPLIGCGAAFLLTGCQDDHFDISSTLQTGDKTIWQNIQNHPELSQYADILQSVYYSQTEEKTTNETYADIFNGDQVFTVWAPANGKFDYDYYKQLLATGERTNIYKVENELIRNNMTRYSNVISGSDSVKLSLFNSKYAWVNYDNQTIKGVEITTPNIGSSNGVLHITDGSVAYQPNLYEYLTTHADLDSINTFIKSFQTIEFDENASTQGPTVDGVATWVDSVTYMSNQYTSSFMNAHINREDSNYVMILPTNGAWDNILEQTKKYFKYKTSPYMQYYYDESTNRTSTESRTALTSAQVDSLQNLFAKNAICQNLAFNANWQYGRIPITSISNIKAADTRLDSLRSTAGVKFKKTGTLNASNSPTYTVEIDNYAKMFGNADPVELSNGYAYMVNEYPFPYTIFAPNHDLTAQSCFEVASSNITVTPRYSWTKVDHVEKREPVYNEETGEPEIDEETGEELTKVVASRDTTYNYNYMVFSASGNSQPRIWFKLEDVRSCKYDIYVVVGYNVESGRQNRFTATIRYNGEGASANLSSFSCKNPDENAVDATGESIYGDTHFVNKKPVTDDNLITSYNDTICLAKDFEFPVSYYGIQALDGMANTYPVLELMMDVSNSLATTTYTRELRINAIILKSKEW